MTFSEVMGRSAGLYINPNQSAAALILGLVVTIGLVPHRYRMLYVVLVGLGVFLTFSRSSLIGWALTAGVFIKTGQLSVRRSLLVGCGMLCVALALMIWQWDRIQYRLEDLGVLNKNVLARLDWFNNPDVSDMSSTERKEVAEFGWAMFSEKPVLGNGLGASVNWAREKSSHNEYLNMMVDHGIIGVFFLPILVILTQWRAQGEVRHIGFAFAIFVLYLGFFSHNVLTERHILMTFALLECMAMSSRSSQATDERLPNEGSSYNHCFAR
jgi:O-antigen ligase